MFTQRDLIENHYKTVKHQIECRKLKKTEVVEMTLPEEDNRHYTSRLYEMNNFTAKKHISRTWHSIDTLIIPLESKDKLPDPRKCTWKHILSTQTEEEPNQKMQKTCIESQADQTRFTLKTGNPLTKQKT